MHNIYAKQVLTDKNTAALADGCDFVQKLDNTSLYNYSLMLRSLPFSITVWSMAIRAGTLDADITWVVVGSIIYSPSFLLSS